jgi:cytochrome c553
LRLGFVLVLGLLLSDLPASAADVALTLAKPPSEAKLRSPVALALADKGRVLLVANERSGTISAVDLKARHFLTEFPIGKRLSDLTAVNGNEAGRFLVTDLATNKLCLLVWRDGRLTIADSVDVSPFPVSVRSDAGGTRCFVALLWSRRLTIVDLEHIPGGLIHLKTAATVPLSFAPRIQLPSPDGTFVVVADAFGGLIAVVSVPNGRIQTVVRIPGHNIRGLAWSADGRRLVIAHQTLSPLAYSSAVDVHWGSVVSNVLRSISREALESPYNDVLAHSRLIQLGDVGNGAGDPGALEITKEGSLYVALGGVGEVAAGRLDLGDAPRHMLGLNRFRAGLRPSALMTSVDGSELYVADRFGDAITIFNWSDPQHSAILSSIRLSLGPQPPLSAAERGERLFFDARLSHDGWMSCHSCHTDGHTTDQLSDTLGDGTFGAAKRIPSLGGVAETGPWAWNGSMHDLAEQVRKSLLTTMHAKSVSDEQVHDLTEYLKSLPPAPPAAAPTNAAERAAVERGRTVYARHGCGGCHVTPSYTSPKVYDVGLRDALGNHKFNPPSLRGVSQRSAFFHDGRADSLNAVFETFRHPGKTELSSAERADLIVFLRSL